MRATEGSGQFVRVSVWESEAEVDAAAGTNRSMSPRSRLQQMVGREHQELSSLSA